MSEERQHRRKSDNLALWQKIISDGRFILSVVVLLLGGNIAGGVPAAKQYFKGPPPTVEEIQPVEDGHYDQTLKDIIAKIEALEATDTKTKNDLTTAVGRLQRQIDKLKAWHE